MMKTSLIDEDSLLSSNTIFINCLLIHMTTNVYTCQNIDCFGNLKNIIQSFITMINVRYEIINNKSININSDIQKVNICDRYIKLFIFCTYRAIQIMKIHLLGLSSKTFDEVEFKKWNLLQVMLHIFSYLNHFLLPYVTNITTAVPMNNTTMTTTTVPATMTTMTNSSDELYEILGRPMVTFKDDIYNHIHNTNRHTTNNTSISNTSRLWLHAHIQDWLHDEQGSQLFWLCARAGVGKSTFVSILKYYFSDMYNIYGIFFCKFGDTKRSNGEHIILSLVYQIAESFPAYKTELMNDGYVQLIMKQIQISTWSEIFHNLIITPLLKCQHELHETILIIIDGLDEIKKFGNNHRKKLLRFLGHNIKFLPSKIRVLISSRYEDDIREAVQQLHPYIINENDSNYNADLPDYIHNILSDKLDNKEHDKLQAAVELLVTRSQGSFMYMKMIINSYFRDNSKLWTLEALKNEWPHNLDDVCIYMYYIILYCYYILYFFNTYTME